MLVKKKTEKGLFFKGLRQNFCKDNLRLKQRQPELRGHLFPFPSHETDKRRPFVVQEKPYFKSSMNGFLSNWDPQ